MFIYVLWGIIEFIASAIMIIFSIFKSLIVAVIKMRQRNNMKKKYQDCEDDYWTEEFEDCENNYEF